MAKNITSEDLKQVKTYSLLDRKSLASRKDFGTPAVKGDSLAKFLKTLPNIYMARDLKRVGQQMRLCRERNKTLHFSMGSHVIKNGLAPYIIDLMNHGYVSALSFNGSALVHDFEISFVGATSEDVDSAIGEGKFGLSKETATMVNQAIHEGDAKGWGVGESLGHWIAKNAPHPEDSLFAQAVGQGIPATVHVAVGTDIIHIHPSFCAAEMGKASHRDFLKFSGSIADLEGGMYFNIGSAVILPEIFLKAISLVRNLGHEVEQFWAVNLDFIRHYRPRRNVLERPTQKGGQAIEIIGPHELILPLLHAAVLVSD